MRTITSLKLRYDNTDEPLPNISDNKKDEDVDLEDVDLEEPVAVVDVQREVLLQFYEDNFITKVQQGSALYMYGLKYLKELLLRCNVNNVAEYYHFIDRFWWYTTEPFPVVQRLGMLERFILRG